MTEIDGTIILVLSPLIVGLSQVVKMAGLPSRFTPLASVLFGVALVFLFADGGESARLLALSGVAAGLTASGLYSSTMAMVDKSSEDDNVTISSYYGTPVSVFETGVYEEAPEYPVEVDWAEDATEVDAPSGEDSA